MSRTVYFCTLFAALVGGVLLGLVFRPTPRGVSRASSTIDGTPSVASERTQQSDSGIATSDERRLGFFPVSVELGRHPWYSKIPFEAHLRNQTSGTVRVTSIKPSCGCTAIDVNALVGTELGPSGSMQIAGILDLGNELGVRRRDIDVMMADGSIVTAEIVAETFPTYEYSPQEVKFQNVNLDDAEEPEAIVIAFRSEDAEVVTPVTVDVPWLTVETRKLDRTTTELRFVPDRRFLPVGGACGRATIQTTDPYRSEFRVPLTALAKRHVSPYPRHSHLTPGSFTVVSFSTPDGETVRGTSVACDSDALSLQLAGGTVRIDVRDDALPAKEPIVVNFESEKGRSSTLVTIMPN